MNRSARRRQVLASPSIVALACALPVLAACEAGTEVAAEAAEAASPSAEAQASGGTGGAAAQEEADAVDPIDDLALRQHLEGFDEVVVIDTLDYPLGHFTPTAAAEDFYGYGSDTVVPASCAPFHQALALSTELDLTSAGGDLINPVGPLFLDGVEPDPADGDIGPYAGILTRVFADGDLAASVPTTLLAADCEEYTLEEKWDGGSSFKEHTVDDVAEITLAGVDSPTVRVTFGGGTSTLYDENGEEVFVEYRDAWHRYVHVAGTSAIMIDTTQLADEEAQIAGVIAAFLEYMGAS